MRKYEELYQLAKEDFAAEVDRLTRVEGKATALLSVLTLLIGIYGLLTEWALTNVLPPEVWQEWAIVILAGMIVLGLAISWVYVFRVLTVDHRPILSVSESVIEFYDKNTLVNIYYAMARRISQGAEKNRELLKKKAKRLTMGYYGLIISGLLVVFLGVVSGSYAWSTSERLEASTEVMQNETNGENFMPDNDQYNSENQSTENTQEPDRNIEAPELQYVQESYDPPTEKKKDKGE